jgi:hypothetical protein
MILKEVYRDGLREWEMKATGPGLCPIVGFRIKSDVRLSSVTTEFVDLNILLWILKRNF